MRKPRRTGTYLIVIALVAVLTTWLVSSQLQKQRLVARLNGPDPAGRVAAARELLDSGQLGESLAMLPTPTRVHLAQALGDIHTRESLRLLDMLLKDQEEDAQYAAADALVKQGAGAYPTLLAALTATGNTKDQAVRALVGLGDPSVPRLRFLLDDGAASAAAQEALSKLGPAGADVLVKAAHCADPVLRGGALTNLAAQKRPETLQACLDNLVTTDKLAQIAPAIAALGVLGHPAATPSLLPFLSDPKQRAAAATSLGLIGDPRGVQPISGPIRGRRRGLSHSRRARSHPRRRPGRLRAGPGNQILRRRHASRRRRSPRRREIYRGESGALRLALRP